MVFNVTEFPEDDVVKELEAESVAYLICCRNGLKPKSETYLSGYVEQDTTADTLDLYQIMRAAGQVAGGHW